MVVLAVATTFTPGPSTLLAAASGAGFGVRRTIPLMAGVAAGLASLMAAASAGLIVVLQAVPSVHVIVKVLGSAYPALALLEDQSHRLRRRWAKHAEVARRLRRRHGGASGESQGVEHGDRGIGHLRGTCAQRDGAGAHAGRRYLPSWQYWRPCSGVRVASCWATHCAAPSSGGPST